MTEPVRIVVAAGQRGAGTSTLAALLALALAAEGSRVLLVDEAGDGGLGRLFRSEAMGNAPLRVADRVGLMTAPVAGVWTPPPGWDVVVSDAGWEWETTSSACGTGPRMTMVVATPERASLAAAYALVKGLDVAFPALRVHLVLNRHRAGTRAGDEELRTAVQHFLGWRLGRPSLVPEDACLMAGLEGGMLLSDAAEGSEVVEAAAVLAARILADDRSPARGILAN